MLNTHAYYNNKQTQTEQTVYYTFFFNKTPIENIFLYYFPTNIKILKNNRMNDKKGGFDLGKFDFVLIYR